MIEFNQARVIVKGFLQASSKKSNPLEVVKSEEYEFGWIFYYNSKKYLETGEFTYKLLGNAPIIVDIKDGSIHKTGTAHPIEFYIEKYRKKIKSI